MNNTHTITYTKDGKIEEGREEHHTLLQTIKNGNINTFKKVATRCDNNLLTNFDITIDSTQGLFAFICKNAPQKTKAEFVEQFFQGLQSDENFVEEKLALKFIVEKYKAANQKKPGEANTLHTTENEIDLWRKVAEHTLNYLTNKAENNTEYTSNVFGESGDKLEKLKDMLKVDNADKQQWEYLKMIVARAEKQVKNTTKKAQTGKPFQVNLLRKNDAMITKEQENVPTTEEPQAKLDKLDELKKGNAAQERAIITQLVVPTAEEPQAKLDELKKGNAAQERAIITQLVVPTAEEPQAKLDALKKGNDAQERIIITQLVVPTAEEPQAKLDALKEQEGVIKTQTTTGWWTSICSGVSSLFSSLNCCNSQVSDKHELVIEIDKTRNNTKSISI